MNFCERVYHATIGKWPGIFARRGKDKFMFYASEKCHSKMEGGEKSFFIPRLFLLLMGDASEKGRGRNSAVTMQYIPCLCVSDIYGEEYSKEASPLLHSCCLRERGTVSVSFPPSIKALYVPSTHIPLLMEQVPALDLTYCLIRWGINCTLLLVCV